VPLEIAHFTDPACPFAFSAEPTRMRRRWHYGDALTWRTRMIVLTREPGEAERLAEGAPGLQRKFGMPIDPRPYPRPASSEPARRAFVAARLNAPEAADVLLRRLRVRTMLGGLLDDPELIAAAARDAGLDPDRLEAWCASEDVALELGADITAARRPSAAARALDHELGGPRDERRYTAPAYEIARPGDDVRLGVRGRQELRRRRGRHEPLRAAQPACTTSRTCWAVGPPVPPDERPARLHVPVDERVVRQGCNPGDPARTRRSTTRPRGRCCRRSCSAAGIHPLRGASVTTRCQRAGTCTGIASVERPNPLVKLPPHRRLRRRSRAAGWPSGTGLP
jgi:2-hydroxychromene-2-carboxylate isomerase